MNRKLVFSLVAWLFVLVGCGGAEEESQSPRRFPVEVELKVPEAAFPGEFWEGVVKRQLVWRPFGSASTLELPLTGGENSPVDFSGGGDLFFEGLSENGAVLVSGHAKVGPWDAASGQRKLILISLDRRG